MPLRALIFDVDGTLAETEEAHRTAFNRAFAEVGHDWHWSADLYRDLLRVTGGQHRIRHFLNTIGEDASPGEIAAMHARKNVLYADLIARGTVRLRPGIARLIAEAQGAGVRLAIATTTSRSNLDALLTHLFAPGATAWFEAIVAGEDVAVKKPDPEVYARVLAELRLGAADVVAIEDSSNGLIAASGCSITTLVTPSRYTTHENFDCAALVCRDLEQPVRIDLATLNALQHEAARSIG